MIPLLVVNVFVDLYIYAALHSYSKNIFWAKLHAIISSICTAGAIVCVCLPKASISDAALLFVIWFLFIYFTIYIPKYLFIIFDALSRIPVLWGRHRWVGLSWTGFVLGILVCLAMWWGALFNRYDIKTNRVDIEMRGLGDGMDGLTIAQISDLHLGTFGQDTAFVSKLVDEINAQRPDIVVFTGDLVNRHASEIKPFIKILSRIEAPHGVYSVMGNHDYGDYCEWTSPEQKEEDVAMLKNWQRLMGWTMLNDSHVVIKKDSAQLALIGVENIGQGRFKTYGNLAKAYPSIGDSVPKVLLSHNPCHWVNDIQDNKDCNVPLTLSGHTHAMQIEVFGFSPAAWKSPTWRGLYEDADGQKLYVNIGAGEVSFPARIGANPEITIFKLTTKQ